VTFTGSFLSFPSHYYSPALQITLTFGTGVLHLIQINHQPDATIFQFIILAFFTVQDVSGVFPPIIRISMTAVAASGFTFVS
jgi:hypothetical protein